MEKIHVLQITVNKQKETFPIDTDFSEKALILDMGGSGADPGAWAVARRQCP